MRRAVAFAVAFLLYIGAMAQERPYPDRPIRIIVPTTPGTVSDSVMRILVAESTRSTGATFVIDNRPGALGQIATDLVKQAAPDGYTFLASSISTHGQAPHLIRNLRYDPVADFEGVSRLILVQWLLVTDPALKHSSFTDFVSAAGARPNALAFGYGVPSALASAAALNLKLGIEAVQVPYRSQSLALQDLVAGRIAYMLVDTGASAQLIKDGKIQALAVASRVRVPMFPAIPTLAELGVADSDFVGWLGLHAPARTSLAARRWLSDQMERALVNPAVVEKLRGLGVVPGHLDPMEFDVYVKSELSAWGKRIKASGIEPQ